MIRRAGVLLFLLVASAPLAAQDADPDGLEPARREQRGDLMERVNRLREAMARLQPWEEHVGYLSDAMHKVFERNGWTSDEHQFALNLALEIESIPPERFQERFERMGERVRERYDLDDSQLGVLRGLMMRDAFAMFSKHSERIVEYASEMMETRADGQAVTPEKVARWVKLAQPVFEDARRQFESTAREFAEELKPEQRAVFDRDLKAAVQRLRRVDELSQEWARGNWSPADWGIEEDPIQLAGEAALRSGQGGGSGGSSAAAADAPPTRREGVSAGGERREGESGEATHEAGAAGQGDARPRVAAGEAGGGDGPARVEPPVPPGEASSGGKPAKEPAEPDDEWARHVREFIRRYKLDQGQQNAAWSAYRAVKEQADRERPRIEARVAELQKQGGEASERETRIKAARKPLDDLFEQLKRRLERLPTRKQRSEAGAGKPGSP